MSSSVCVYIILESPPKTSYDEIAASLQERRCPKRITKQRRCLGMTLASWGTVTRIRILLNPHASFSFRIWPVPGCDIVGSTELRKREHEKKKTGETPFFTAPPSFSRAFDRAFHICVFPTLSRPPHYLRAWNGLFRIRFPSTRIRWIRHTNPQLLESALQSGIFFNTLLIRNRVDA